MYTPFLNRIKLTMGHMRISSTEPSSVILSQRGSLKSWKVMSKKWQAEKVPKIKLKIVMPKGMV